MIMNKILGTSLAIIMVLGSTPLGFSEPLRVQLEQRVSTDQLQCDNESHVLVQRSNGNMACVTEISAEKMGWGIIDNLEISISDIKTVKNYWFPNPDENIEEFAKKFAAAAGVTLTERSGNGEYKMEPYVSLDITHLGATMRLGDSDVDVSQSEIFVRDFMDYMGFEYEEKDFHERPTFGSNEFPKDRESYLISKEHSSIRFEFIHYEEEIYEGEHYDENHTIKITFTGWTNHPELIVYHISEDKALQYAKEFSKDLKRNLNLLDGYEYYGCELIKHEKINVSKKVVKGIPYYVSEVGLCTHTSEYPGSLPGMFSRLMLHQDAVNGTDIFIEHGASGE